MTKAKTNLKGLTPLPKLKALTASQMAILRRIRNGRKMDRYTISNQPWELEYAARRMQFEGYQCSTLDIQIAKKIVGKSRKLIYAHIRSKQEGE